MSTKDKAAAADRKLGPKWKSRVVGRATVDPRKLKDNPLNWRVHGLTQQRVMRDAIEQIGIIDDIVVNKRTGNIIDGHGRKELAIANEEETVDVLYVDLSVDEERLALSIMNPLGELASTDPEKLGELLGLINRNGGPLDGLLADLEEQASGAIVKELDKSKGGGGRAVTQSRNVMRMMLENPDVMTVERALSMTGLANRGDALLTICRHYLGKDNADRQHDTESESSLEDQLAKALSSAAGDSGNARRPRKSISAGVPGSNAGRRVRTRSNKSGGADASAPVLERVSSEV